MLTKGRRCSTNSSRYVQNQLLLMAVQDLSDNSEEFRYKIEYDCKARLLLR
ncbi:5624_t:CDS:1, partial [Dentiscutata erythropus]